MGGAAGHNIKDIVEVGLPVLGNIRILHAKSYRKVGLAASGNMRIF